MTREGTNGDVTVFWRLSGVGPSARFVTAEDTGVTSGSITMRSGKTCHYNNNNTPADVGRQCALSTGGAIYFQKSATLVTNC